MGVKLMFKRLFALSILTLGVFSGEIK